jgi:hypothetical protein
MRMQVNIRQTIVQVVYVLHRRIYKRVDAWLVLLSLIEHGLKSTGERSLSFIADAAAPIHARCW